MIRSCLLSVSLLSFAAAASAQCSTLSVAGTGAPGTSLTFVLDGSTANALAFLAVADTQATRPVDLGPLGSFTLNVDPYLALPIGLSDAAGNVTLGASVPNITAIPGMDLFAQGVTASFGLTLPPIGSLPPSGFPSLAFTFCVSNVVGFHYGS